MIEKIFIISFIVFAIWYTMKPGEIFSKFSDWLERLLPEKIHPGVFACPVCMVGWHGSALYWIIPWVDIGVASENSLKQWPVAVIAAMGLNAILSHLFPLDLPNEE
jgi:hypothetical protein